MSSRVLVLGSRGFLGRHVVEALAEHARVEPVRHVRATGRDDDPAVLALDLATASADDVRRLIDAAEAGVVINCAGRVGGEESAMRALNVTMVHRLLEALGDRPSVRLVHLGSAAEYGASAPGIAVREADTPFPSSAYAVTKLEASLLVQRAGLEGRVASTVLRVFNPVGAGAPPGSLPGRLAGELHAASRSGARTVHVASLSAYRDFIDARDVASAALAAVGEPSAGGAMFNVGRGEAVRCRDLAAMLLHISGQSTTLTEDADPPGRSAAVSWQQADITAITTRLGWHPRRSIGDAVERLWTGVPDRALAVGA